MASRRRAPARRSRTRKGGLGLPSLNIPPDVIRSLVGLTLLVLGVVTLIMLALPSEKGTLTDWARTVVLPNFGTGRWLLPIFLLVAGGLIEWRPLGPGWRTRLVAAMIGYAALLGLFEFLPVRGGGRIGTFLADVFGQLITRQGAFVVLAAIFIGSILITANLRLAEFVHPFRRGIGSLGAAVSRAPEASARAGGRTSGGAVADRATTRTATLEPDTGGPARRSPAPVPSEAPMSQTVVSGALRGGAEPRAAAGLRNGASGALDLLTIVPDPPVTTTRANHADNIRIIEDKLNSFGIPATVVATNTGPVVTQYEVRPERHIKLSRIEGLADDLAMALAARTIRIEAPIPGKDVVGIEIPNVKSEIVSFRRLLEESKMLESTSPLTFALGRDVSGKAYAVDLAKMPHLLVAGATGSGKSVCINALITSLLMHSRPDEVRLILVDLKRVELAPYDRLPHLLTPVINEPRDAKSALDWAVHQMEERYKALASRGERNIAAFNASPHVQQRDRLPQIVIIIDELADLIMREGRKVEEPIVKIAQKARAVGIHLVLATQRPSVNVVTGLIKANVPSRIAFAMASMIDSRTVLDQPGAEDLIGRGDMLYQPVDLPRPVRMQGVFVNDDEVRLVTDHWRQQAPEPLYDADVLAYLETEGNGDSKFGWLAAMAEDEMAITAAELVTTLGKASTSMLQTKLKVGFSRASRLMDELERYGIISPGDPRNPAVPRIVYGPDNWLVSHADIDDPGA